MSYQDDDCGDVLAWGCGLFGFFYLLMILGWVFIWASPPFVWLFEKCGVDEEQAATYGFWAVPITIVTVTGIVVGIYWYQRIQREKEAAIANESAAQDAEARRIAAAEAARLKGEQRRNERIELLQQYFSAVFIIDSNIWMDDSKRVNDFFVLLGAACNRGCKFILAGWQFDEIVNVKKRGAYESKSGKKARLAISRIEKFQVDGHLNIDKISVDAKRGVYSDPLIVKVAVDTIKKNKRCVIITNDVELRIRVRSLTTDEANQLCEVISLDDFLARG